MFNLLMWAFINDVARSENIFAINLVNILSDKNI